MYGMNMNPWGFNPWGFPPTQPPANENWEKAMKKAFKIYERMERKQELKKKPSDNRPKSIMDFGQHFIFWMAALPFLGLAQVYVFCEVVSHAVRTLQPIIK